MATGERCVAAVRAKGEAWALRLIDFAEHEDCSPADRPGSVTKRTVRRSSGAAGFPNDLDVVEVRGLVKNADGVVACCYGSAVGDAPGEAGEAVFWRLDEDARASFVSAPGALFAPLCRGLELAVKRMTVGEVADVSVRAPDLGFVRPPSTAKAPLEPRLDDMAAFHYGGGAPGGNRSAAFESVRPNILSTFEVGRTEGSVTRLRGISASRPRRRRDSSPRNLRVAAAAVPRLSKEYPRDWSVPAGVDGANSSVADARCYGAGLEARLELVSVARHGDGLAATVLSDPLKRAEQFLDLADEAKALGAAHYKRGAFARAARRYGAAVAAAAVAATALETVQPEGLRFDPEDATGFAYREAMKHATAPDTVAGELDLTGMPKPEGYGEKREPLPDPPTEHQSARNQAYATANARGSEILRACRLNRAACGLKRCTYKTVCDDCHASPLCGNQPLVSPDLEISLRCSGARKEDAARRLVTAQPVTMSSSAASAPINRGSRCVPPAPGRIPKCTSGRPTRAHDAITRAWQLIASSKPPPSAVPWIAAVTGIGASSNACMTSPNDGGT